MDRHATNTLNSARSHSRSALREGYHNNTTAAQPPSTPPNQRSKRKGKQPLRAHASRDEGTIAEESREDANNRHSHGLSWSSTTRDSVVDNLLFSLDNLSRPPILERDDADADMSKSSFPPSIPMGKPADRKHMHTYSSSMSSEYEARAGTSDSPSSYSASPKGRRSASGSNIGNYPTPSARMRPSTRASGAGKGSTDTSRTAFNSSGQKEGDNGRNGGENTVPGEGHSGGAGKNKPAWGRRSMSMDQIYAENPNNSILHRGRPVPSVHSSYEGVWDASAPEPMIPAGPRKMQNPSATGPVYVNQPQPKSGNLRKMNTQSDLRGPTLSTPQISQDIRNQASDFVRASTIRGAPSSSPTPDHPQQTSGLAPPNANSKDASPAQRERPGFFKRVFGGRAVSGLVDRSNLEYGDLVGGGPPRNSTSGAAQPPKTSSRQVSREDQPAVSQPPSSLSKKPSSFFRRRKKSTSEFTAPAVPSNPNANTRLQDTEQSPSLSSLRKVMDPYLNHEDKAAAGPAPSKLTEFERPETHGSSTEDSDTLDMFHSGYTPPPDASLGRRNPLSREPSTRPNAGNTLDDSPRGKLKIRKRKPEITAPPAAEFVDTRGPSLASDSLQEVAQRGPSESTMRDLHVTPKVSPLTESAPDFKENRSPVSRASLHDMNISAGSRTASQGEGQRNEDYGVRSNGQERPASKRSTRLILQPSSSDEHLGLGGRDPKSTNRLVVQPSLSELERQPDSEMHSPVSPDNLFYPANSLPLPSVQVEGEEPRKSVEANGMLPSELVQEDTEYLERARKIFEGDEEDVGKGEAASWLGERNVLSMKTLQAYMQMFDIAGLDVLSALRSLSSKLVLKGETQQFDRIITALSSRWCECNPNHGFKAQDVVHTITYSLILLNTDLHLADIGEKMSRSAYVKNTLPTIKRVVTDAAPNAFDDTVRPAANNQRPTLPWTDTSSSIPQTSSSGPTPSMNERSSFEGNRPPLTKRLSLRPAFDRKDSDQSGQILTGEKSSNALVSQQWTGSIRNWELEIENILKTFYASIRNEPLPLHGAPVSELLPVDRNQSTSNFGLKRSGSVVSKAPSDNASFRSKPGLRTMTAGFQNKYNRSRSKVYPGSIMTSSRTSFDDGNSIWSPVQSSNMSKYSMGKTFTTGSMQSLGTLGAQGADFKHSIGFANALSQAIIREEGAGNDQGSIDGADNESVSMSVPVGLLEDDSLALEGAPWAKEGLVKHKHHLETPGKKAKERNWHDIFAVINKGTLSLFNFNTSGKSHTMSRKAMSKPTPSGRASSASTTRQVGGGDWMDNAQELETFTLRQTIASTLPPPGYSKTRPHVWALSLPSGAVHLFQVGTPEIAAEFMTTANYWSARLSKEPLTGGVSNIEYGWSDAVINTSLIDPNPRGDSSHGSISGPPTQPPARISPPPSSMANRPMHTHTRSGSGSGGGTTTLGHHPRPSIQSSLRGSFDTGFGGTRTKLPGDKISLAEWKPPQQSPMNSRLMEVDQLRALRAYVGSLEEELGGHNELKGAIELAYSPRAQNFTRALANWQRKSDHLLREIVKFQTYIDSLVASQSAKEAFYARKAGAEGEVGAGVSPAAGEEGEEGEEGLSEAMEAVRAREALEAAEARV